MQNYKATDVEKKWQKSWRESEIFKVDLENSGTSSDASGESKKYYNLTMFPYPSGDKLHIGHWYNYGPVDTWGRYMKMRGKEVFQPMGFDSFGLPAENYAIKTGVHPAETTRTNIEKMKEQIGAIGGMYDLDLDIETSSPEYYKWTQWLFLQLYKNDLAYRKEAPVNWCGGCQTVLANEQVENGACERCKNEVIQKNLTQWFFKITDYADELYENIDKLDGWPERTKAMQKNWIGKSHGTEIDFEIADEKISNVVIVHGANDSRGEAFKGEEGKSETLVSLVGKRTKQKNVNFSNELYPKDWNPEYSKWKKTFEENKIDESTILVGHSLGCGFISRWLSESRRS